MSTAVKYFDSTMSGAPSLSGTAGALIGVLGACLVDGFGSVTVDSLVVASNVVTATVSAGHQFAMVGNTGPVIRIAGASPSGLNGDWRVTVTSSTVFTFTTSGIGDQTATGTISAKRAPAGFSKAFSGTNKAAYRADDITGTRLYCWIDDTGTTNARGRGYETMSDVDTGTGLFPTDAQISGGGYVWKSGTASSATRKWTMIADTGMMYFFCDPNDNDSWFGGAVFGDGLSYISPDAYNAQLLVAATASANLPLYNLTSGAGSTAQHYLARSYTQLGTAVGGYRYSHGRTTQIGDQGQVYPALTGNAFHAWPVDYWEGTTIARGLMPGLWNPLHDSNPDHGTIIDDIPQLEGRTIIVQRTGNTARAAVDITGPWR